MMNNSLTEIKPEIANEWHPTKNGKLTPEEVTIGSHKIVWWLGSCGHEWEATVKDRVQGRGCPICAGKRVVEGVNDIQTLYPAIAKSWHPTKNGDLLPSAVSPGSSKKVWWICKNGHEWQAAPKKRISDNTSCPFCSNQKVLKGFNDLATTNPKIAAEWHPTKNGSLTPYDIVEGSNKRIWWICRNGHEWQASAVSRVNGSGCPFCSNRRVLPGYNDLATTDPLLAREWHPTKNGTLKPEEVTRGAGKKVWWICNRGHEWQATPNKRTSESTACPFCSNQKVLKGFNDLATTNPRIAAEWHPIKNGSLTPNDIVEGSKKTNMVDVLKRS